MNFRKIAIAIALSSAAMCLAASMAFGADPVATPKSPAPATPPPSAPAQALAQQAPPGSAGHALDVADLGAWLDGFVPYALENGDIAGAVVAVVKDGKVLFTKGYGYADVKKKTPMDPDRTLVRIGSTSKLFTWTAVMQLVEQGKLDLDRDVNDYLDFKIPEKFGKPITLRDLMNHRGGFEEGLKDLLAVDPRGLQSTEQYLKQHPRPMLFAPGEVPAYSNYGAAVAGYIVERVSGEPFEAYVEHHIFQPLGMTSSTFRQPLPAQFQAAMSRGYMSAAAGKPYPYELVTTAPAGSVAATASDMARYMNAHLNGGSFNGYQMLSPETEALMQTPTSPALPGFASMAHGFFHFTQNGRLVVGHGGDTVVFHTEMNLLPQEKTGIFFSFNSRGRQSGVYLARKALFDGFMDRYFPAPPTPDLPTLASAKKDAQEIAGRYESSRRVEHGFISVFYLLQQSTITANPDGTISMPDEMSGGVRRFREVGPQLWREEGGTHEVALRTVDGVKTVIDSEDPTSVSQAASFIRSGPLNTNVLMFSVAVLLWTLLLWPLAALLRKGDGAQSAAPREVRRLRMYQRGAAAVDLAYLFGWYLMLQPILANQVGAYGTSLDGMLRVLQVWGLVVIAAAALGLWVAYRTFQAGASWPSKVWSVLVALALLGMVWIGFMGRLIGFSLNY
jgi:CubicO group peptidase (beta-lactamase class C family)